MNFVFSLYAIMDLSNLVKLVLYSKIIISMIIIQDDQNRIDVNYYAT